MSWPNTYRQPPPCPAPCSQRRRQRNGPWAGPRPGAPRAARATARPGQTRGFRKREACQAACEELTGKQQSAPKISQRKVILFPFVIFSQTKTVHEETLTNEIGSSDLHVVLSRRVQQIVLPVPDGKGPSAVTLRKTVET